MNYKYTDIKIEEFLENKDEYLVIDVRSEGEYAEDHIINSINIPILNNEERHLVGLCYKENGPKAAKKLGRELTFPHINEQLNIVYEIKKENPKAKILIYCHRGGDRSKIFSTLLALEHGNIFRLTWGYKAYRNFVLDYFKDCSNLYNFYVLYGHTGVGKTDILNLVEKENVVNILDLEKLANHRGSVYGHVGLKAQPSQRLFESRIFAKVFQKEEEKFLVEGESRKIGKRCLPERIYHSLLMGQGISVETSIENRCTRIYNEYYNDLELRYEELQEPLQYIKPFISNIIYDQLNNDFLNKDFKKFIENILVNYYDVLYLKNRKMDKDFLNVIIYDKIEESVENLVDFFKED